MRFLAVIVAATLVIVSSSNGYSTEKTQNSFTELSWDNLFAFFKSRYNERAPNRFSEELATRHDNKSSGFHFDPVVSAGYDTTEGSDIQENKIVSTAVSQGSPWGTEVSYTMKSTDYPEVDRETDETNPFESTSTTLTLTQKLMKNGLLYGLSPDGSASTQKKIASLEAKIEFETNLYNAILAFVNAQQAFLKQKASEEAHKQAQNQNRIVKELVQAGYKAKADTLVSDSAEIKANLQLAAAKNAFLIALEELEAKLWQHDSDPKLKISKEVMSNKEIEKLANVSWPKESPQIKRTKLKADLAEYNKDLAVRSDLPTLDVSTSMTKSTAKDFSGDSDGWSKSVGLSLSIPLVSSIRRDGTKIAAIELQRAKSNVDFAHKKVRFLEKQLQQKIKLAKQGLLASEKLYELEKKTLSIEKQKYSDGKSTVMEIRRSQNNLDRAAVDVISARSQLILSKLELAKEAGKLHTVFK